MIPFRRGWLPRTIAHRGGSGIRPENTVAAFGHAHDLGIRTMELDVHLTSDDVLVVHHDISLDRTTNGTGPLSLHTLADLRSLDAGHRFVDASGDTPYRGRGLRIPTLEEIVTTFPDVSFIVELKPRGERIAHAVRSFLDAHSVHERLCIAGFHEPTLACFRGLSGRPAITSAGSTAITRLVVAAKLRLDRLGTPPCVMLQLPPHHHGIRVLDRRLIDAAHGLGIEVHAWTIDEPQEMRELLALGVDAIITDRPDLMAEVDRTTPARA